MHTAGEMTEIYADTLDGVVVALCADFGRRMVAIDRGELSRRCEMEYRYLNYKISDAATEIAGQRLAPIYIKEIGSRCGYAKTEAYYVSESTYKRQKREIKLNIAKHLHLI